MRLTITREQLKPDKGPIFGASTTDPRFATGTFLTVVASDVTVPRRNGGTLDFYASFTTFSVVHKYTINKV